MAKLKDNHKLILFVLALFSLEISYVFPMMFFVVWIALIEADRRLWNWRISAWAPG